MDNKRSGRKSSNCAVLFLPLGGRDALNGPTPVLKPKDEHDDNQLTCSHDTHTDFSQPHHLLLR